MSFKRILPLLLLLACICGMLPAIPADAVPTKATISVDKTQISTGEDITFTISSDGSSNTLWIYRVDGQWSNFYQNVGTSYTESFGWAGEYKALVEAWDGTGHKTSDYVYFTVGDPTLPTYATIGCDKSVYKIGDTVAFSMSGDGKSNTLWIYKPDGTREHFTNAGFSYTYIPTMAGQYEALMETWTDAGCFTSEKIRFRVVDPNAPSTTISTTKATTTASTTKATTTASTTKATTTASTTAPTTASTTKPTTVSTTKPTTAPTTKPTTVKPSGNADPCAKGHRYQNGYCIYCAKADPNYNPCALGHTFQNGFCIFCLREDPTYDPCAEGHTFENGYCINCLFADPRVTTTTAAPTTAPAATSPTTSGSNPDAAVGDPVLEISPVIYIILAVAAIVPLIIIIRSRHY